MTPLKYWDKIKGVIMNKTIYAVLTSKKARSAKKITESLDAEFSAGAPWFDKLR